MLRAKYDKLATLTSLQTPYQHDEEKGRGLDEALDAFIVTAELMSWMRGKQHVS
jgi:hypothetical protein